jgi:hypothetical protein
VEYWGEVSTTSLSSRRCDEYIARRAYFRELGFAIISGDFLDSRHWAVVASMPRSKMLLTSCQRCERAEEVRADRADALNCSLCLLLDFFVNKCQRSRISLRILTQKPLPYHVFIFFIIIQTQDVSQARMWSIDFSLSYALFPKKNFMFP